MLPTMPRCGSICVVEPCRCRKLSQQFRGIPTSCQCSKWQPASFGKYAAGSQVVHIGAAHAPSHCVPHKAMPASSMSCYWSSSTTAQASIQSMQRCRQRFQIQSSRIKHSAHLPHRCTQTSRPDMTVASFLSEVCKSCVTGLTHTYCRAGPRNRLMILTIKHCSISRSF